MSPPRAVVVATGSELVRGERRDANGPYLAGELARLGLEPARIVLVGDRPADVRQALEEGVAADLCVVSGGLGPTHDDRTVETVAAVTGRELRLDEALAAEIEARSRAVAERIGRPYADFRAGVRKQALVPDGAVVLGIAGTAPALLVPHDGGRVVVVLPGPPNELRRLWPRALEQPAFQAVAARAPRRQRRSLRFFGPTESAVARALAEAGGETDGLEVTICAHGLEIHVDLLADEGREAQADDLAAALGAAFPRELFAADDTRRVEELVLDACREHRLTLATAESCTGGLVAARLTSVPGASDVFVGSVVAYSNDVKESELDVSAETLAAHGAVSAETAAAMAAGARRRLGADVAVAVTGIAGPGGGTDEKPVGLVHVHACAPNGEDAVRVVVPGDREAIRERAAAIALHAVRRALGTKGDTSA